MPCHCFSLRSPSISASESVTKWNPDVTCKYANAKKLCLKTLKNVHCEIATYYFALGNFEFDVELCGKELGTEFVPTFSVYKREV